MSETGGVIVLVGIVVAVTALFRISGTLERIERLLRTRLEPDDDDVDAILAELEKDSDLKGE